SSLAITFISSIGTSASKVVTGQVTWLPAIIMVVARLIASPLGAKKGKNINTTYLQWILDILILGTAVNVWMDILLQGMIIHWISIFYCLLGEDFASFVSFKKE